jgi:hypothetical protein
MFTGAEDMESEPPLFSLLFNKLPSPAFVILSFLSHFISLLFSTFIGCFLSLRFYSLVLPSVSLSQHPGDVAAESLPGMKIRKK